MKCSEYIKSRGVKSLRHLSEVSEVPESTLKVWYTSKRFVFNAIVREVLFWDSLAVEPKIYEKHKCKNCGFEVLEIDSHFCRESNEYNINR